MNCTGLEKQEKLKLLELRFLQNKASELGTVFRTPGILMSREILISEPDVLTVVS